MGETNKKSRPSAKKIAGITALSLLAAVLVIALIWLSCFFCYRPAYLKSDEYFDIAAASDATEEGKIRVMSYNVRCIAPQDSVKLSWYYRADYVTREVASAAPDVICFQEVTPVHYEYLSRHLVGYDSYIKYRDDSMLREGVPVFYRTDKYNLIEEGAFWLSETPEVMSKGWGAANIRITNYVVLEEKVSKDRFAVYNVHLDHVSELARKNSAKLIAERILAREGVPAVVAGDFNSLPDTETYGTFVNSGFKDCALGNNEGTYQDFGRLGKPERLDYCFTLDNELNKLQPKKYQIVGRKTDGIYPSDHYGIVADIDII